MRGNLGLVTACAAAMFAAGPACSSEDPRGAGEECFASSECGPGLVCNLAADPPVCAGTGAVPPQPDAPPQQVFDAGPTPDGSPDQPDSGPQPPDAAPPDAAPPDAAPPDAAPPDAAL